MTVETNSVATRAMHLAFAGALAVLVAFACMGALQVQQANAATPSLTGYAKAKGASSFKSAAMGKTVGKTNGKALVAVKIAKKGKLAGNVSYTVGVAGGKATAKNGKVATKKNKLIRYLSIKLTGKLKSTYHVWYRVYTKGGTWTSWVKNGAKATSAKPAKGITAFEVQYIEKGTISGSTAIDKKIAKIAKSCNSDLETCFQWCACGAGNIDYGVTGLEEIRTSGAWGDPRILQEAKLAFNTGRGDCYTYAVAFYCLAKKLGYNARPMAGTNLYTTGLSNTSWTEIKQNGEWLFCDAMHADKDKTYVYLLSHKDYTQSYQYYSS